MSASEEESIEADQHPPIGAQKVSPLAQGSGASQEDRNREQISTPVPDNVFTGTLQSTLVFTTVQIRVLVENGYYTQNAVMYWEFTYIKYWC